MGTTEKKLIIGLLGGIGSGKSTGARILADLGCAVVDADKLAKEALNDPELKPSIIKEFGTKILSASGNIDRPKLAALAFQDQNKLSILTKIIHPRVLAQTRALINSYQKHSDCKAIVLDIPLLAEVGWETNCDVLIFVNASEQIRYGRAAARGLDPSEVKNRENFQISLDNKARMADYIVNNNSDLSEFAQQVSSAFHRILESVK